MIYANNAGTSWPKPGVVPAALAAALEEGPSRAEAIVDAARATVCEAFGIPTPERFLFASSCTSALAVSIEDLPWRSGDRVLTSSLEHHALVRPIRALARRGVGHGRIPYRPGMPFDLDVVREELRRGGVRLVAITGASNVTGELLPIAEITDLAHEHGALCLLDAAQLAGVVPLDVAALGVDLFVFAGHKGPLGPQGIGGLWAADRVVFDSPVSACRLDGAPADRTGCAPFPGYCDLGSVNVAAAAGLAAGIDWRSSHDRSPDAVDPRALARRLARELAERPSCTVYGAVDAPRTATVSCAIDGLPVDRAEARFAERGIVVRAGEHCAADALEAIGAPAGTIRISFGPHNAEADLQAILETVEQAH